MRIRVNTPNSNDAPVDSIHARRHRARRHRRHRRRRREKRALGSLLAGLIKENIDKAVAAYFERLPLGAVLDSGDTAARALAHNRASRVDSAFSPETTFDSAPSDPPTSARIDVDDDGAAGPLLLAAEAGGQDDNNTPVISEPRPKRFCLEPAPARRPAGRADATPRTEDFDTAFSTEIRFVLSAPPSRVARIPAYLVDPPAFPVVGDASPAAAPASPEAAPESAPVSPEAAPESAPVSLEACPDSAPVSPEAALDSAPVFPAAGPETFSFPSDAPDSVLASAMPAIGDPAPSAATDAKRCSPDYACLPDICFERVTSPVTPLMIGLSAIPEDPIALPPPRRSEGRRVHFAVPRSPSNDSGPVAVAPARWRETGAGTRPPKTPTAAALPFSPFVLDDDDSSSSSSSDDGDNDAGNNGDLLIPAPESDGDHVAVAAVSPPSAHDSDDDFLLAHEVLDAEPVADTTAASPAPQDTPAERANPSAANTATDGQHDRFADARRRLRDNALYHIQTPRHAVRLPSGARLMCPFEPCCNSDTPGLCDILTKREFYNHVKHEHDDMFKRFWTLQCHAPECNNRFLTKCTRSAHYSEYPGHTAYDPNRSLPCPIAGCSYKATSRHAMSIHRSRSHPRATEIARGDRTRIMCTYPECGLTYSRQAGLTRHLGKFPRHSVNNASLLCRCSVPRCMFRSATTAQMRLHHAQHRVDASFVVPGIPEAADGDGADGARAGDLDGGGGEARAPRPEDDTVSDRSSAGDAPLPEANAAPGGEGVAPVVEARTARLDTPLPPDAPSPFCVPDTPAPIAAVGRGTPAVSAAGHCSFLAAAADPLCNQFDQDRLFPTREQQRRERYRQQRALRWALQQKEWQQQRAELATQQRLQQQLWQLPQQQQQQPRLRFLPCAAAPSSADATGSSSRPR